MSAGSEILIQIAENKLKVAEIPIIVRYDIEEHLFTKSRKAWGIGIIQHYRVDQLPETITRIWNTRIRSVHSRDSFLDHGQLRNTLLHLLSRSFYR